MGMHYKKSLKSAMKPKFRSVLLGVLAVLAFGAVAASAAQAAAEGPFYKIAGTRLASGKTQEVKGKSSHVEFFDEGASSVTCDKAVFAPGAKLLGSTGANLGYAEVTLEFSECTASGKFGGHLGCEVEGRKFNSEPLYMDLSYTTEKRQYTLGAMFKPVNKAAPFVKIKTTSGCFNESLAGSGVGADLTTEKGYRIEAGEEPAAAKILDVVWSGEIHQTWLERAGALEEIYTGLGGEFGAWYGEGTFQLELPSGTTWGVFT